MARVAWDGVDASVKVREQLERFFGGDRRRLLTAR
jgi:hypothetical protein